jgi:hypothetical protein
MQRFFQRYLQPEAAALLGELSGSAAGLGVLWHGWDHSSLFSKAEG